MRRFFTQIPLVTVLFITAWQGSAVARVCGNQDFKGVYGPLNQGNVVFSILPELVGPFARVGLAVADGAGGFIAQTIDSVNGFIATGEITGTYTVTANCSVTLNLLVPLPILGSIPFTFVGAVADNGRQVTVMPIDPPGLVIPVNMRRQDKRNCGKNDLSGGYLVSMSGSIVQQPPNTPGLFNRIGIMQFDGRGNFTADTHVSYNGNPGAETFSGTYLVESSCMMSIQYSLNGTAYIWTGMLTDNSQSANLLVTSPMGAVVTGTLKQQ